MKKVLEIINLYENAVNFIGSQFLYLSENGGYEMHLICSAPIRGFSGIPIDEFCRINKVRYKIVPINRLVTPLQDLKSLIEICKYIRKNKIDIIITHQAKGTLIGMLAGWITRTPYKIIMGHGVLTDTMKGIKKTLIKIEGKFVSSIADYVICVSDCVRQSCGSSSKHVLLGHGSCTGIDAKVHFNPELLDVNKAGIIQKNLGISEDDYVIGFSGRLVCDKGIIELVDAFKMLKLKYDNLKLLIIGPKEVRDSIPNETFEYMMSDKDVIFTGYVDYAEIQYYYSQMNVCVLPSYREGLGLAPLEAEAMCVPAIVSDHTGCKETVIDGETGYYCKVNSDSIAENIEKLLDKNKAKLMGRKGREFVVNSFESEIVHENILQFLCSQCK